MERQKIRDIIPPSFNKKEDEKVNYTFTENIKVGNQTYIKPQIKGHRSGSFGLFIYFTVTLLYLEFIFKLFTFGGIGFEYIYPALFALPIACASFLIGSLFNEKSNKIITGIIILLLTIVYLTQFIYYHIFQIPLSLYSIVGAVDAVRFWDVVATSIYKNIIALILLIVPLGLLFILIKKPYYARLRPRVMFGIMLFGAISYSMSMLGVYMTKGAEFSQYELYFNIASPDLAIRKLGVLTAMRLDLERLTFGFEEFSSGNGIVASVSAEHLTAETIKPLKIYNALPIDFNALIEAEKNSIILDMHSYFSSLAPTKKNDYTGFFKGNNLIFIVAEAFSPYAVSPELTPTLYKMSKEGFVFKNFYNPVWGVSTSDGEYVASTGLLPKSGVWSMYKSAKNNMPFVLGNQFKKLGYNTKAYHNNTYTYYARNVSLPNFGYDYKALGNGLKIRETWPESDLEMIDVTANEYISSSTPFHVYYMTVSGHVNYNFYGNFIAAKNKSFVDALPYSDESKAYIAGNLEVEFAMTSLIDKLDKAGVLKNTVISIVPDHYPYGLAIESINELAGHDVEKNFELYKSIYILWKSGMSPITVDKSMSTLDILPTLSNLFGLEYDSRLLMGSDIFSGVSPLVIFLNRSWITDKTRYNSITGDVDDKSVSNEYVVGINKIVANKFKYSTKVLETNYYDKIGVK
ncbi:MAG: sulfatase-like hydrolase/transferase [bacterium]|nr:sulfatase-like hydrolase/transferase [bacterium]